MSETKVTYQVNAPPAALEEWELESAGYRRAKTVSLLSGAKVGTLTGPAGVWVAGRPGGLSLLSRGQDGSERRMTYAGDYLIEWEAAEGAEAPQP